MVDIPKRTDGVAFITIKKPLLAEYLAEIRKNENLVPLSPIDNTTESVMIIDKGSKEPQYLIEIDYTNKEND